MNNVFATNSLWGVIAHSSMLSKVILVGSSIVLIWCLFVFIYKMLLLRDKLRHVRAAQASMQHVRSINDLVTMGSNVRGTLPGVIIARGLKALKEVLSSGEGQRERISQKNFELVQDALDQALMDIMYDEQEHMQVLSISSAAAPLVGLFGTISGLIQAFIAIGQEKTTDIATIAPGIAEALITTFAGILVAIPALVMYHLLANKLKGLEHQLIGLISRLESVMHHTVVE